ncbi:HAMP domain-containing protein [Paenibacillus sp. LMG 31461]|uniref:HAMP domain-containing protein n=1 Tax=Paenibacillus plantarum TaxID=2654975 RepID=A0ABX1X2F8_9BACL|nr:histidine kinase [Paenibacillus plantarum]NOU62592.1 HAMP domain-containing protein [Paenibacillus plantarum]
MLLRQKFEKSIQFKLTTLFLLILLPLVSVSLFGNQMSQTILKKQIGDRVHASILTSVGYLDLIVQNVGQMSFLISTDKNVNEVLSKITKEISSESLYELRKIQQQFSVIINVNHMVQEMSVIHGSTGNALSYETGIVHFNHVYEQPWYQEAVRANGAMIVYVPDQETRNIQPYWKEDRIYFIRIMDPYNLESLEKDLVITAIAKSALMDIVEPLIPSNKTELSLSFKGKPVIVQAASEQSDESKLFSHSSGEMASGWELTIKQQEQEILKSNYQIRNFTYVIMLVSILLALSISIFVYSGISKPLFLLSSQMKQVSIGNLNAFVQHQRQDELGYVMNTFNTMVTTQKQLIEDGYEKELHLAKSQFRLLQSQINPHFLYNTLDCIYTVSEEHDVHEVSEMVMNLANFFRVSLGKGRETFTVEETLEHLMYYIRIQQIRLMDRFTVNVTVQPEARKVPLLRLLLQPLIENAIVHGLEKVAGKGSLTLTITLEQQCLHIVIQDTGIGLKEDALHALQEELEKIGESQANMLVREEQSTSVQFFALKNVKSRLKLFYGEQADLRMESIAGEGTKVTVIMPVGDSSAERAQIQINESEA